MLTFYGALPTFFLSLHMRSANSDGVPSFFLNIKAIKIYHKPSNFKNSTNFMYYSSIGQKSDTRLMS